MKLILTLVLVFAFLLLPMSGTFAATDSTASGTSTKDIVRMPDEDYRAVAKAYCKQYGETYTATYAKAFKYAVAPLPEDYSAVKTELPQNLYEHLYNTWSGSVSKSNYKKTFKTNVQLLKSINLEEIKMILNSAKGYMQLEVNIDYVNLDERAITEAYHYYFPSGSDNISLATEIIEDVKKFELTQEGYFITDQSLVYQAPDGQYRVRGRAVHRFTHATEDFLSKENIKLNAWYYYDTEICLVLDNTKVKSKYDHAKYVVEGWTYISNGWAKASSSLVKLAKKYAA